MATKYKFRLLAGQHVDKDVNATPIKVRSSETGELVDRQPSKTYDANDPNNCIIETDIDLVARFGSEKFRLVAEAPPASREEILARRAELDRQLEALENPTKAPTSVSSPKTDFDSMTKDQLEAYAAEHEIDISSARTKADILAILKS